MILLRAARPAALGLALAILAAAPVASAVWGALGQGGRAYPTGRLLELAASHAAVAVPGAMLGALAGFSLGLAVTRPAGRALRPLADALVAAAQAVPPVVVVALAFPVLGFGAAPTLLALLLYAVMPVLRGTVAATNTELEKLSLVTEDVAKVSANATVVSENAAQMTSLFTVTLGGPLVKTAALGYGIRKALRGEGRRSRRGAA